MVWMEVFLTNKNFLRFQTKQKQTKTHTHTQTKKQKQKQKEKNKFNIWPFGPGPNCYLLKIVTDTVNWYMTPYQVKHMFPACIISRCTCNSTLTKPKLLISKITCCIYLPWEISMSRGRIQINSLQMCSNESLTSCSSNRVKELFSEIY